jgi:hypothetical protein
MIYKDILTLTDHLDNVIEIWVEFNKKYITEEAVDALKETIRLTVTEYYRGER